MITNYLFQEFLNINPRCNYRCGFCDYWRQSTRGDGIPSIQTEKQLRDFCNTLLSKSWWNKPRIVHVVGGEPLESPLIFSVLKMLKTHRFKVWVWTNLSASHETFELCAPFVDKWAVYLPSSEPDQFRVISGESSWSFFGQRLDHLVGHLKADVFLHYPVRSETVENCAHVYEYGYYKGLSVLFHYSKDSFLSKDAVEFVNRFYKVPKVWVFNVTSYLDNYCQAIPVLGIRSGWQWAKNYMYYVYLRLFSL